MLGTPELLLTRWGPKLFLVELHCGKNLSGTLTGFQTFWLPGVPSAAAAAAKLLQSCLTLCDPADGTLPGFAVPGILQARTLEWVAISFSSACKWKVKVKSLRHIRLLVGCSLPGSSVHGIFQARVLEWGGIAFSGAETLETVNPGASVEHREPSCTVLGMETGSSHCGGRTPGIFLSTRMRVKSDDLTPHTKINCK